MNPSLRKLNLGLYRQAGDSLYLKNLRPSVNSAEIPELQLFQPLLP
jgi:hypothetical protein